MPHIARARLDSLRGATEIRLPSILRSTSSGAVKVNSPLAPLTATVWPSSLAVTPLGTATGFLPIRDIVLFRRFGRSEDLAQDFAANMLLARCVIGHDAFWRRDDRHAKTVGDARHGVDRGIDPPARLRDALDLPDRRLIVRIFQFDLELGAAIAEFRRRIAADIAFGLKHVEHMRAEPRAGRRNLAAAAHLRVADAGEHIAQRIVHRHVLNSSPARLDEAGDQALVAELA